MMERMVYPFTAVLGQEHVKNALIWNVINPAIGGVLLSGDKGTAKSTLVRGMEGVTGQKLTELPLNTTEDRLIGTIDFEQAVKHGLKRLEPGILHQANGGILYVDEVNLLSDQLTKVLLDVASSGVCLVEREGISYQYDAEFSLIGSMNPEEGGLRPQFIDRFGLYVEVQGEQNLESRVDIIARRLEYEQHPEAFLLKYEKDQQYLHNQILSAQEILPQVEVGMPAKELAAQLSKDAFCAGHRAELVMIETAKAIAAYMGRYKVEHNHIVEASKYALPHRMRQVPNIPPMQEENQEEEIEETEELDESTQQEMSNQEETQQTEEMEQPEVEENTEKDSEQTQEENQQSEEESESNSSPYQPDKIPPGENDKETVSESGEMFQVAKWLDFKSKIQVTKGSGRRSLVKTNLSQGRYVKSKPAQGKITSSDIAFDATLRAAAPYQKIREKNGMALVIEKRDMKIKQREKRTGNYILFVVDASGSMGAGKRMQVVKGAVLSLLSDAYQKRDKVGMIMFKHQSAEVILDMTRSVDLAQRKLEDLPTGGKTPLCFGIETAHRAILTAKHKDKEILPVIVLISDGRATYGRGKNAFEDACEEARSVASDKIKTVVIDAEQDFIKLGLAKKIAEAMDADYIKLDQLRSETLLSAVNVSLNR